MVGYARSHLWLWSFSSLLFNLLLLLLGGYLFKKENSPMLLLGLFWMWLAYLPTSFFTWDPFVSRYSYLPAIGLILIIAALFFKAKELLKTQFVYVMFAILVLANVYKIQINLGNEKIVNNTSYRFAQGVNLIKDELINKRVIYVFNSTPHLDFILKDVLYVLADIPKDKIVVLENNNKCPLSGFCLRWEKTQQKVLLE